MIKKAILQLKNSRWVIGAATTAWLNGRLVKDTIKMIPSLYTHHDGYDPRIALMIQGEPGKPDKLNLNLLFDNFKSRMASIDQGDDARSAAGESKQIHQYYEDLRTGRRRYFRKEDILQGLDNIQHSYNNKYKDEKNKEQRGEAYRQLRAGLEQRLDPPSLLRAYIKQGSPMEGRSFSEISPGSVVTSRKMGVLRVDVLYDGKSYQVTNGPDALLSDRVAAIQEAVALTAADQRNEKGEVTGSISIETDNLVVAETAYISARRQGFEPSQIKITCTNKEKPFVIRDNILERNVNIVGQRIDRYIREALNPEHPDRPDISPTESVGFESDSAKEKRTLKATLANQSPANQSPLGAALNPSGKNKGTGPTDTTETSDDKTAVAIGTQETSGDKTAVAIGTQETSGDKTAVAIGTQETSDDKTAVAIGTQETSGDKTAVAIGTQETSDDKTAVAIGTQETSDDDETIVRSLGQR